MVELKKYVYHGSVILALAIPKIVNQGPVPQSPISLIQN